MSSIKLCSYILLSIIFAFVSSSEILSENTIGNRINGKPPVFYADNGNHQTIPFPLNRNRERREFESEILQFLGLSHEPHPKRFSISGLERDENGNIASSYMLDLYKNLEESTEGEHEEFGLKREDFGFANSVRGINHPTPAVELFDPTSADTIMSFINQKSSTGSNDEATPTMPETQSIFQSTGSSSTTMETLRFDLSEVQAEFQLIGAELRLFYNGSKRIGTNGRVNVYGMKPKSYEQNDSPDEPPLMLLTSTYIESNTGSKWLLLNVTNALSTWINSLDIVLRKDLVLYLDVVDSNGYHVTPEQFGLSNAFVVGFFNGGNEHAHERASRKKRAAAAGSRGTSRREDQDWPSQWSNLDAKWSRSICQKRTLYVSFRDLGWQDWIIAPDGYAAYYCYGECSFPLNSHMNASNHAIVQTLAHLMNPQNVPKPCCAPNKLQSISVLYFDDSSNVVLKKYNNMVVNSCGCH